MLVVLFIVILIAVFGLLNVFTLVLPRQFLKKRQDVKNAERQAFAMSQGWYFQPYAPEVLTRYGCPPFTERGDRRVVFGLVTGQVDGMQVTTFDYQRRTKSTSYSAVVYNDTNEVVTVWAVKLPTALPYVEVSARRLFMGNVTELRTADQEFNKRFVVSDGDANLAARLLTPQVIGTIQQLRLGGWTIHGDELIYPMVNTMTRTTAQEIVDTARCVVALVRAFPAETWGGAQIPAPQTPAPQIPAPQGMQQPMSQPVPMQQPVSQPFPQPVQQPMPQQGQYPQQGGWAPQPQPQPGYPPQQGYPQPGYPQQNPWPQGQPPNGGYPPRY
ncbi:hypothetical protein [Kibdelosporangium phytohabitans]|uniref:Uncharacterized protein n=1 Tax=Kibdelosporangium phytohabitans TaxID=860235 RepID=A0A0N7F3F6_9PSEU|nr:hypothetical protein [Kibdelosporangium phytohabitans]ALG08495.1 hypothetical protein AOZ06_17640 [Kibdelosporangium phytohabitans]MBE1470439.1 hypothetical protein [Kibdelosporangium phytohabitans]